MHELPLQQADVNSLGIAWTWNRINTFRKSLRQN